MLRVNTDDQWLRRLDPLDLLMLFDVIAQSDAASTDTAIHSDVVDRRLARAKLGSTQDLEKCYTKSLTEM